MCFSPNKIAWQFVKSCLLWHNCFFISYFFFFFFLTADSYIRALSILIFLKHYSHYRMLSRYNLNKKKKRRIVPCFSSNGYLKNVNWFTSLIIPWCWLNGWTNSSSSTVQRINCDWNKFSYYVSLVLYFGPIKLSNDLSYRYNNFLMKSSLIPFNKIINE